MMVPVRCFTCGTVVGSAYDVFQGALADGKEPQAALDSTGLTRFCCRRMLVAHVQTIKDASRYE